MDAQDWMDKKEAAAFLRMSVRSVERLMHTGRVSCRYEPGRTRPRAVLSVADLQGFAAEREARPAYPQRRRSTAGPRRRTRDEMHTQVLGLERKVERLQEDLCDAVEIVLEYSGMTAEDAREWVDRNLRSAQRRLKGGRQCSDS